VLLILDGLPARHVVPSITPTLHGLATDGGWHVEGGRSVMASSTYANHRTFITGVGPAAHGIAANEMPDAGRRVPADQIPMTVPTVFDAVRTAGLRSELVVGDHHLVAVMGGDRADAHWPPRGAIPDGLALDELGYLDDVATMPEVLAAVDRAADLLVVQLNRPDTAGHLCGPDTADAHEQYRRTDDDVAEIVDALQPSWDDTVLLIVSDHDQEMVTVDEPYDLGAAAKRAGVQARFAYDGSAAAIASDDPHLEAWLADEPEVASVERISPSTFVASAQPGGWFGRPGWGGLLRGVHGGESTRAQVAIVTGGAPVVAEIAASLLERRPHAADWAPTCRSLLGLPTGATEGSSLG
jgi:arylsulfatase A-like enzyme